MGLIGALIGGAIGSIGGTLIGSGPGAGAEVGGAIGSWLPFARGGTIMRPPSRIEQQDVQLLKRGGTEYMLKSVSFKRKKRMLKNKLL